MANNQRNSLSLTLSLKTQELFNGLKDASKRVEKFVKRNTIRIKNLRSRIEGTTTTRGQGIQDPVTGRAVSTGPIQRAYSNFRKQVRATSKAIKEARKRAGEFFKAIRKSAKAVLPIKTLQRVWRGLTATIRKARGAVRLFGRAFRSLGNARFVIAGLASAIAGVQFARLAGEISNAEVSFRSIVRTLGSDPKKALEGFRDSLKGTASDLEIARQVATAAIFDIADSAIDLQKIFDTARRLGRATGRSTGEAIRDISLGIGRQSRLILDNIGLIVRVQRANEVYADSVGKTVEQLTDLEKKFAFQKAALDAADVAVDRLGKDYDTFNDILLQFTSNISNAGAAAAKSITPVLREILENVNKVDFDLLGKTLSQFAQGGLEVLAKSAGDIPEKFNRIAESLGRLLFTLSSGAGTIFENFVQRLEKIAANPLKEISALLGDIAGVFATAFTEIFKRIFNADTLKAIGTFVLDLFRQILGEIFSSIGTSLEGVSVFGLMSGPLQSAGEKILGNLGGANDPKAFGFFGTVGNKILNVFGTSLDKLSMSIEMYRRNSFTRADNTALDQYTSELEAARNNLERFYEALQKSDGTIRGFINASEEAQIPLSTLVQTMGRLISDQDITLDDQSLKESSDKMKVLSDQTLNAERQMRSFKRLLEEEGIEIDLSKLLKQAGLEGQGFFERILGEDKADSKSAIEEVTKLLQNQIDEAIKKVDELAAKINSQFGDKKTALLGSVDALNTGDLLKLLRTAFSGQAELAEDERQSAEDLTKASSNKTKFDNISVGLNKQIFGLKARIAALDSSSSDSLESIIAGKVREAEITANNLGLNKEVTEDFKRRIGLLEELKAREKLIGDFKALRDNVTQGLSQGIMAAFNATEKRGKAFADAVGNALSSNLNTTLKESFDDLISGLTDGIVDILKEVEIGSGEMLNKIANAVIGIIGLFIKTKNDTNVTEVSEDDIQASSSAVRGVIAGPQNIAIAEIGDSIAEANRGTESLLGDILDVLEDIRGNNLTSGGIGAAGTI